MNFYDRDFRFNRLKFKNYANKQRALSEISRRLTVGSRKYGEAAQDPANRPLPHWSHLASTDTAADDRHIYLGFRKGNGSWGAGKKKVPAPTKRLLTHLRQIARLPPPRANRPARPMVTLIMLDEYLTPQICANCHQRTLEHVLKRKVRLTQRSMLFSSATLAERYGTGTLRPLKVSATFSNTWQNIIGGHLCSADHKLSRNRLRGRSQLAPLKDHDIPYTVTTKPCLSAEKRKAHS